MGFSDVTTLLNAITKKTKLITFHGPSGNSTWNEYSVDYFRRLLMDKMVFTFQNKPGDSDIHVYQKGKTFGDLMGGNLTVLTSLIGSGYLPDWKEKILFLEDVSEEPYSIDRMLMQLKLNGAFDQVKGIVLGNFRKCTAEDPNRSFTLEEVFDQYFSSMDIPVFSGAQIGHTLNKFTIPVGAYAQMDAEEGTIRILYPAVS
jgi:muramoyltetrapeptide carboxypeptidase